jgi:hypothetical protein
MINIFYFFIIAFVISTIVYLVTPGEGLQPLKHAAWVFAQLVGGMLVLALVVHILTNV